MMREEATDVKMIEEVLRSRPEICRLFDTILSLPEALRGDALKKAIQLANDLSLRQEGTDQC